MAKRKRKSNGAANEPFDSSSSPLKRARPHKPADLSSASHSISHGRVDPTYGQRSAIPGLDDGDYGDAYRSGDNGGEGEEGEVREGGSSDTEDAIEREALRYLRSVREEASGIPNLLVAPKTTTLGRDGRMSGDEYADEVDRSIYDDGIGDSRGWYNDGAYAAAPTSPLSESAPADADHGKGSEAQKLYYETLLRRFEELRRQLAQIPPRYAVERLSPDHGSYMSGSAKDYKTWRWRLKYTEPKMAQLAGMDKGTVLRLLQVIGLQAGGHLNMQDLVGEGKSRDRKRVSAWIWGLLAKLPDRGELGSEEVAIIRDLGKRAVWVGAEMKGVDMTSVEDRTGEEAERLEEGEGEEEEEEYSLDHEQIAATGIDGEHEDQNFQDGAESDDHLTNGSSYPSPRPPQGNIFSHQTPMHAQDPMPRPLIGPALPAEEAPQARSGCLMEGSEAQEALSQARARLLARVRGEEEAEEERQEDGEDDAGASRGNERAGDDNDWEEDGEGENNGEEQKAEEDGKEDDEIEDAGASTIATKALLETIITVAGEMYGQRDLLEFREAWE